VLSISCSNCATNWRIAPSSSNRSARHSKDSRAPYASPRYNATSRFGHLSVGVSHRLAACTQCTQALRTASPIQPSESSARSNHPASDAIKDSNYAAPDAADRNSTVLPNARQPHARLTNLPDFNLRSHAGKTTARRYFISCLKAATINLDRSSIKTGKF